MIPFREAREKKEREEYEAKNPKISHQFADAKRALSTVTDDEWANLPDAADHTKRNKRQRQNKIQRFYAVPDSVIAAAQSSTQLETSISASDEMDGPTNDNADGTMTNFAQIGAAQKKVLQVRLDQAEKDATAEAASGTATSVDPRGYLTSLEIKDLKDGDMNIGDINRTRSLLESVTNTNPTHAPGWISAARIEEIAGKIVAARGIIMRGCKNCPKSEDVWLEAIRLYRDGDDHNAKVIAADSIKSNPRSVKLWLAAMELETDQRAKKKVVRQALDHIPQSVTLWKAASNLEGNPSDAKLLLAKATDFIPLSIELWLALARLETPENARSVLNKARKAVPTSYEVWIAACRLEEQLDNPTMVKKIMERGVKSLAKEMAMLKREEWIAEAEKAEKEGAVLTCRAIIEQTLGWELDEDDDRKDVWLNDAKEALAHGCPEAARAIYAYALRVFVTKKSIWQAAADVERSHGTPESLHALLEKAIEACPKSDELWLQLAKETWQSGNINEARKILARAFNQNLSENVWLAAVKLEADAGHADQANALLAQARVKLNTDRVWAKSVAFERVLGNVDEALELVTQALAQFPNSPKLYMMKGQIFERQNKTSQAREAYTAGTRACPKSVPLWLLATRLEESAGIVIRARSILDRARQNVPNHPVLWLEAVRLERRAGKLEAAQNLMSTALKEVPESQAGMLWAERIVYLEPRAQRLQRAIEAIKAVENDAEVFVVAARLFWTGRKLGKAVTWFEKALVLDPERGDSWAWYMAFLMEYRKEERIGDIQIQEKIAEVKEKCTAAEPKYGEIWQRVAKEPENAKKTVEEVLMLAVKEVGSIKRSQPS